MLDIKFVRENLELVDKAMRDRNHQWDKDEFISLDKLRKQAIGKEEELQAKRNSLSKKIGVYMREGKKNEAEEIKTEVGEINVELKVASEKRIVAEEELKELLLALPNIPHESTPLGQDEQDNPEVRRWGKPRKFSFEYKTHWELGPELGIIDFERGVKLAKSRFYLLSGAGAKLERALINFMLDAHSSRGYKE